MIIVRRPESIFSVRGSIQNGTFSGRWHFSFDQYYDPEYIQFGTLRVFNDDILSPGAVWPLHPHKEIEVVTYCADGEFRHADERGKGGVLKKGWVQHTTVGKGMWHSEINNLPDKPLRFIQMWFIPSKPGLKPSMEQKQVEKEERTNRLLPLVSPDHPEALPIVSEARVFSCFLQKGYSVRAPLTSNHGVYLYVLEGGTPQVNGYPVPALGTAKIIGETEFTVTAEGDTELLLVDVLLL
ncbi:MAG: pirin family protein [Alphaproteobacteria bacterium]|uniref:Pirin family protein n=1 Tax=Candidatus Nitrobium versatile TaxID=2884831 RepID=A0A953J615_9BACT|nr:pirin family protein [Candidatus Nitrobium versatile]